MQCLFSHIIKLWAHPHLRLQGHFISFSSICPPLIFALLGSPALHHMPLQPSLPLLVADLCHLSPPTGGPGSRCWVRVQPRMQGGLRAGRPIVVPWQSWMLCGLQRCRVYTALLEAYNPSHASKSIPTLHPKEPPPLPRKPSLALPILTVCAPQSCLATTWIPIYQQEEEDSNCGQ